MDNMKNIRSCDHYVRFWLVLVSEHSLFVKVKDEEF